MKPSMAFSAPSHRAGILILTSSTAGCFLSSWRNLAPDLGLRVFDGPLASATSPPSVNLLATYCAAIIPPEIHRGGPASVPPGTSSIATTTIPPCAPVAQENCLPHNCAGLRSIDSVFQMVKLLRLRAASFLQLAA